MKLQAQFQILFSISLGYRYACSASFQAFRWRQRSPLSLHMSSSTDVSTEVNAIAWELIDKVEACSAGQIGVKATEEEQAEIDECVQKLTSVAGEQNDAAYFPLTGDHDLLYSMSAGGSSGAIGPFVGKVTQKFVDDEQFINGVKLGPLSVELLAIRNILDGTRIRVKFQETTIKLFGFEVSRSETKGAGVWKNLYVSEIERDGDKRLLRVMETPSLFIIQQKIS